MFILFLFLVALIGYFVVSIFGVVSVLQKLSLSLLIGSLFVTYLLFFALTSFSMELSLSLVLFLSLGILFIVFFIDTFIHRASRLTELKTYSVIFLKKVKKLKNFEKFAFYLLAFIVIFSVFSNLFWPVTDWDAITLYDFRGKLISTTGHLPSDLSIDSYILSYPPYTSLLHAIAYTLNFNSVKVWYSMLYGSFLLSFYILIKKNTSKTFSLASTLLLAISPMIFQHSIMAYTNLPYSIFLSLGIIYMWSWIKDNEVSDLLVGSLLIVGTTWIRASEPFWIILFILLLVGTIKYPRRIMVVSIVALLSIKLSGIWDNYLVSLYSAPQINSGFSNQSEVSSYSIIQPLISIWNQLLLLVRPVADYAVRLPKIFNYINVFVISVFKQLLIGLVIIYLIDRKVTKQDFIELSTVFILFLMIVLGTLIYSFAVPFWEAIGGSATRMSMFFIPLFLYLITKKLYNARNELY